MKCPFYHNCILCSPDSPTCNHEGQYAFKDAGCLVAAKMGLNVKKGRSTRVTGRKAIVGRSRKNLRHSLEDVA